MSQNNFIPALFLMALVSVGVFAKAPPTPPPFPGSPGGVPKQVIAPSDVEFRGREITGEGGFAKFKMLVVGEQVQVVTDQGTATFEVVDVRKIKDDLLDITVAVVDDSDQVFATLNSLTVGSPVSIVVNGKTVAQTSVGGINAITSGNYIIHSGPYRIVVNVKQKK